MVGKFNLPGGKPVKDLLEREITKVKDGSLILATYEKMREHWLHSKRKFDQTIIENWKSKGVGTYQDVIHGTCMVG